MALRFLPVLPLLFASACTSAFGAKLELGGQIAADLSQHGVATVADGNWATQSAIRLQGLKGTAEKPLLVCAANRGKAIISGHSGFALKDCEHVVIDGFVFENDANQQAVLLEDCRHVRVTRCTFHLDEGKKARWGQYWVYVIGSRSGHNRIDHNLFERQRNRGSMVFVRGDDATLSPSQYDRIDHNHFRDVVYANDNNGHETLRTGSNDMGAVGKSTHTTIEDNLLERCSGEQEIISLKSSGNMVRRNTFIDCRGAICLRLGNRCEVADNVMLNPGKIIGAGGVKVYGFEHRITGNYFEGLTGTGHSAPLALIPGTMETESTDQIGKLYKDLTTAPATRVQISGNVWVNCAALVFGNNKPDKDRKFSPVACVFTQNTLIGDSAPLFQLGLVRDLKATDNLGFVSKGMTQAPWASWFVWQKERPDCPKPAVVQPVQVGPDAADQL